MAVSNSVFKYLRLYTTGDKFFIESLDPEPDAAGSILEIDRVTQDITLSRNIGQLPSAPTREICGILGITHLLSGCDSSPENLGVESQAWKDKGFHTFLCPNFDLPEQAFGHRLADSTGSLSFNFRRVCEQASKQKRTLVGLINDHEVWKVQETDIIPFPKTTMHLSEDQARDNRYYLQMIKTVLNTESFYFSYTHDLTHTFQRLHDASSDFQQNPLFERSDVRFVWNTHLLKLLAVQPELSRFVLPVMHGFVSIEKCNVKQYKFDFVLISRRSCFRAGTRYNMRGVDNEGEVANFVETEQIIFYQGEIASYVQTRGSIPLFWSQRVNLKYKPKPAIVKNAAHNEACALHIESQIVYYGNQMLVNLIDQKGSEKQLGDYFAAAIKALPYHDSVLRYIAFDFHKECSKMRWHRLSLLMDSLRNTIDEFSYFRLARDKSCPNEQSGVIRSNCMDCLDRTNVVQSLVGKYVLQKQLVALDLFSPGETLESYPHLEVIFKNTWADNADACAKQYTGTGALKTDFTRTGKRTKWGLVQDGINSAMRYYKNNFADGFRQDAIDLFLGNCSIDISDKRSPFNKQKDWKYVTLPVVLLIGLSMLLISLLLPSTDFSLQLMYVLFWAASCVVVLYFVLYFGTEFVNHPKLVNRVKDATA